MATPEEFAALEFPEHPDELEVRESFMRELEEKLDAPEFDADWQTREILKCRLGGAEDERN